MNLERKRNWKEDDSVLLAEAGVKCKEIIKAKFCPTLTAKDKEEVLEKDAKDYADSIHAIFVETSAKNAVNVNEIFTEISQKIPLLDMSDSGVRGLKLRRQQSDLTRERTCC